MISFAACTTAETQWAGELPIIASFHGDLDSCLIYVVWAHPV